MTAPFGTEEFAANLALRHLGQPEIASLQGDATTRERKELTNDTRARGGIALQ